MDHYIYSTEETLAVDQETARQKEKQHLEKCVEGDVSTLVSIVPNLYLARTSVPSTLLLLSDLIHAKLIHDSEPFDLLLLMLGIFSLQICNQIPPLRQLGLCIRRAFCREASPSILAPSAFSLHCSPSFSLHSSVLCAQALEPNSLDLNPNSFVYQLWGRRKYTWTLHASTSSSVKLGS